MSKPHEDGNYTIEEQLGLPPAQPRSWWIYPETEDSAAEVLCEPAAGFIHVVPASALAAMESSLDIAIKNWKASENAWYEFTAASNAKYVQFANIVIETLRRIEGETVAYNVALELHALKTQAETFLAKARGGIK